jgi:hypothetical protein
VALERLDGVGGATWIITAGGRQERREHDLIPAHEQDERGARSGEHSADERAPLRTERSERSMRSHRANSRGSCVAARRMSLSSASNDAAYASRRALMTTSIGGVDGRRRVRTSSRRRRFNRLRSTADLEYRGTTRPTRGWSRGEATARTSRCVVRTRFPSRAMPCSSAPRVSRWLRGKPSPKALRRDCSSDAGVLARDPNGQPLPPFLPAAAERLTSPFRRHPRAEPVRASTPLVAGTVGRLTHGTVLGLEAKEGATSR